MEHKKAVAQWEKKYLKCKVDLSINELCKDISGPWRDILNYCENAKFESRPNYEYLKSLFEPFLKEKGSLHHDDTFDWVNYKKHLREQRQQQAHEEKRLATLQAAHKGKLDQRKLKEINKL